MDIGKALITAVQAGGPEGLKKLRTMGVTAEWLTGDARKLYEFLVEFQDEYSAIPSDQVIQHKTGIILEKPDAPLDFYLQEFLAQRLEVNLLRGVKDAAKLLETSPAKALEQLKNLVVLVQKEALVNAASEPLGNSVDEALDYFTKVEAGYRGVPTPWASVNDQTMGWWPEDLVLWVARLGVGKSFALILMAQAAIAAGKRVLFLTTEMSRVKITLRWLALSSNIPYSGVVSGKLAWHEKDRLFKAGAALKELEIMRVVGGDFDFQTKYLGGAIEDANPDVVFIDGAYLLRSNGKDRIEKAANTFDELKRIATRMRMPIVCTTQFNREVKKESVDSISIASVALTDVAGWNATCAFALHRDDNMKAFDQMDIIPLKLREGKEKKVPIHWDIDRCNFAEREESSMTVAPGLPTTGGHEDGGEEIF